MQGFVMMQTYKYSRNSWENQEKAIFDGVGMYDIPVIEPEEYHHVEWIGFNSARTTQKRKGKGIHFFLDDYQFMRIWKYPGKTASREVRNRYENQEKQAYRKTLATMVRKGLNKETRAAEYIDRYRYNWDE